MDCTSEFQDQPLTVEPICNKSRSSWGRLNMSCRFRSNGASVSATMVRPGYAVDYRRHSGPAYARLMKEAAPEKRGLWSVNSEDMPKLAIKRGQVPNYIN